MARKYLKVIFKQENIEYLEDGNSFIINCGGNDEFVRIISFINKKIETWTYNLELSLNIKIDTAYERIIIEY